MNAKNRRPHLFITIEGVDGTGKSTVAKMLATFINAAHIVTPSPSLNKQRELIESTNDRTKKFDFYKNSIIQQRKEIELLLQHSDVICDRYIHSTFAYQWPIETHIPKRINNFIDGIKIPDFSFLLTVNEQARISRINSRELTTGIINKADHQLDIINTARKRFLEMDELTQIDTSQMTPEDVCRKIIEIINA